MSLKEFETWINDKMLDRATKKIIMEFIVGYKSEKAIEAKIIKPKEIENKKIS